MFQSAKRLFASLNLARHSNQVRRTNRPARSEVAVMVEMLEERKYLSAQPISDLTQWAQQFPAPTHTQNLILNFDGKHSDGQNIVALCRPSGQNRDASIQDVIYQVQEMFSPFNVRVERGFGDGLYSTNNGDSTIFIGGDLKNVLPTNTAGTVFTKLNASYTPAAFSDFATSSNINHAPNSDLYDLAFVDPMTSSFPGTKAQMSNPALWTDGLSDNYIASSIAHEAGHTFGLPHVRTDGRTDPAPLGISNLGDIMSYNTQVPQTYFANTTLPVTDFNYVPGQGTAPKSSIQPISHYEVPLIGHLFEFAANITTADTFTYLQTILGKHYSDGYDHATDPKSVDPSSTNLHAPNSVSIGSTYLPSTSYVTTGVMDAHEGFVGYQISTGRTKQFHLDVVGDWLTTTDVMVKDSTGQLVYFNCGGSPSVHSHIDFQAVAGQTYSVIVGNEDYNSWGGSTFTLSISSNEPVPVIAGSSFTFLNSATPGMRLGQLTVNSEDVNTGNFSGVYYDMLGIGIPVFGNLANTITTSSNVTTTSFSFNGSATAGSLLAMVQFSGKLTGNGGAYSSSRHDTVSATGSEEDFLMPFMAPLWIWGGVASSKGF